MSWLENLNPITGAINAGRKVVTAVFGDKAAKESQNANIDAMSHQQFAAEFGYRSDRTWWDSLIDGLNRLPRPVITFMLILYFWLSWTNPKYFAQINAGLATTPEFMWNIALAIIGFFFGARELAHYRKNKGFKDAAKAAKEMQQLMDEPEEIDMRSKYEEFVEHEH